MASYSSGDMAATRAFACSISTLSSLLVATFQFLQLLGELISLISITFLEADLVQPALALYAKSLLP